MTDKKADVVHSSTYAETQNANGIGATSAESFAARQALEAKRTMVKNYKDSIIATTVNPDKTGIRKYDSSKDAAERAAIREKFGGERSNKTEKTPKNGGGTIAAERTTPPPARINPGISR